jgi:hypothetical protein
MTRRRVAAVFVLSAVWQLFWGGFSSLQLGAPGVGDRASWVPNVLVLEAVTLLPLGFLLCLWGSPAARALAAICAAASLLIALVGVVTLSSPASSFIYGAPFLALPGLALLMCVLRMRRSEVERPGSS